MRRKESGRPSTYSHGSGKQSVKWQPQVIIVFIVIKLPNKNWQNPTTIRHLTGLKELINQFHQTEVDITVGDHDLPFLISSMSFGSQNETAFRAYAEGADRLNMVSLNGEGGEIKDMLGKYPKTRGQQIASGRFGVNAELLNSSNLLEIKIGQGAKPGEGGHLPGSKVTAKVAAARNATLGSDLISPSNNHDIYSIEDFAQMILRIKDSKRSSEDRCKGSSCSKYRYNCSRDCESRSRYYYIQRI